MREAIGVGDTPEIALERACEELGVETHEVKFEILEFAEKKKWGLFGGKPAKVRAYIEDSPAQAAAAYLTRILEGLGATQIEMEVKEAEDGAIISLSGEDSGIVIGHHGETLDALQYLVGLVANHVRESYYRITLDIGNYREKRERTLQQLAKRMAHKALSTNRRFSLEPMNPYERRIIHTAVQDIEGVSSWSEGTDMGRHVVIGPTGSAGARPPRRGHASARRPREQREETAPAAPKTPVIEDAPSHSSPAPKNESVPLYGRIDVKK